VTHAPWPGPARKPTPPPPESDELLAEVLRQLGLEFAGFGIALAVLLALLAIAGCAATSVQCANLAKGQCTVSSTRFLTDSAVTLDTPGQDGQPLHLGFTSQPNQAGVSAAFAQLGSVIGLLGKLVAAKAAPDQPTPTPATDPPGSGDSGNLRTRPQALESPEP
jgi:hypothetical protein